MKELKRATTIEEQIEILERRGLILVDKDFAYSALSEIGYYRFAGYTFLFYDKQKSTQYSDHRFKQGVSFDEIYAAYKMDEEIRILLLKYLLRIETRLKFSISHRLGLKHGSGFYLTYRPDIFIKQSDYDTFMEHLNREKKRSQTLFIKHHRNEYGGNLPIWVALEILSMGDVSKIYKNLKKSCRKEIEQDFCNIHYSLLTSWFQGLTILRNMCAHNDRLYKSSISHTYKDNDDKAVSKGASSYNFNGNKLFNTFRIIAVFMKNDDERQKLISEINEIADKYHSYKSLSLKSAYGFTDDWEDLLMKQI